MKIAFDLTQIPANKTGAGIYALNLVREITRLNTSTPTHEFLFFIQDDDPEFMTLIQNEKHCTLHPVKSFIYRNMLPRLAFEQFILPRHCKKENVDIIFSTHYTIPYFTRIPRVVVFHDMTFYLFPELHEKIKRLYFKTLMPHSVKKSRAVITVSESTKNDVLTQFPLTPRNKISVIHHGVDAFDETKTTDKTSIDTYLQKYGLTAKEYVLFVGTLEPRKNITGLLHAYHHLRQSTGADFKLVIVGKKGWFYREIFETVKKYKLEDAVVFTGYVDETEKRALLSQTLMFLYPSFYEGFGIPILEAMAAGAPVITGNTSSLPEVAGDAALLVNPHEWEEIAAAMKRLLTDPKLQDKLKQKGLKQAASFTWEKTAEQTMELLQNLPTHPTKDTQP